MNDARAVDDPRYVGIVEIRITPQYLRDDGVLVSEGGEIAIDNLGDQTDLDLLKYARNALGEEINAREEFVPTEYGQLLRRVESWPWERLVFPVGTLVRARDGGPAARVVQ